MTPQGGTALSYVYDTLNRLTTIQAGTANHVYTYTGVNPLVQSLTRPNGSTTSYLYNGVNQLTEILNKTSTNDVLNQHVFTYNNLDLRGNETISGSALPAMPALPEETRDYAYNTVNQLLSVTNPNLTFVYDDDGNITQGYTPEGYVFTADYDAEDRMTSLEYPDSSSVVHRTEYRYSGDGFLAIIRKFEGGSLVNEIRIVRDGFLAVQERDENNAVVREYTWGLNLGGGIGGLLNLKQGGQDYSYLYDGNGNVAAVLDASQSVVAAYRYAPFGKLLTQTGSLTQPFGFSTKRYDEQTGLIHYQYRPYAPEIGRWLTRDPLGEEGGMNLYAFVGNNPVNWVDPWGLQMGYLGQVFKTPNNSCETNNCSTSFGECYMNCLDTLLLNPFRYGLATSGIALSYVVGNSKAVINGTQFPISTLEYYGGLAGSATGLLLFGKNAALTGAGAGLTVGSAVASGLGYGAAILAGWGGGVGIGCALSCGSNPCDYSEVYGLGDFF